MDERSVDEIIAIAKRDSGANAGKSIGASELPRCLGMSAKDLKRRYLLTLTELNTRIGCVPNVMTRRFSDDDLLRGLANLVRKLKQFPDGDTLRFERRHDKSVPNDKTLGRFGSKAQLVARLAGWSRLNAGFEDVASICEATSIPRAGVSKGVNTELTSNCTPGYVYLMKFGVTCKIGSTGDIGQREKQVDQGLPGDVDWTHWIKTDDRWGIEAYWHKRFAGSRIKDGRKNWYKLQRSQIDAFRRRKQFM